LRIRTERLRLRNGPELRATTHLEVRFADGPDAPADCRQPKNYRDQCRTFDGIRILALYARELGQEPPQLPPDLLPRPTPAGFQEVTTLIRFTVDPLGQPSDCTIVESTAPALLAAGACSLLLKHGRYTPAHNPAGQPIARVQSLRFRWQVPLSAMAGQSPATTPVSDRASAQAKPVKPAAPKPRKIYPGDDTVQTPL